MAVLTKRTGPGGTEFLLRPKPFNRKEAYSRDCSVPRKRNAKPDRHQENLELARHHRQQFWVNTCREAPAMQPTSPKMLELHRQYGWCFCSPSAEQVQYILDALDSARPGWEEASPQLFFQTLELNFPELLRVCRALKRA
jgi:hypothetical protein